MKKLVIQVLILLSLLIAFVGYQWYQYQNYQLKFRLPWIPLAVYLILLLLFWWVLNRSVSAKIKMGLKIIFIAIAAFLIYQGFHEQQKLIYSRSPQEDELLLLRLEGQRLEYYVPHQGFWMYERDPLNKEVTEVGEITWLNDYVPVVSYTTKDGQLWTFTKSTGPSNAVGFEQLSRGAWRNENVEVSNQNGEWEIIENDQHHSIDAAINRGTLAMVLVDNQKDQRYVVTLNDGFKDANGALGNPEETELLLAKPSLKGAAIEKLKFAGE